MQSINTAIHWSSNSKYVDIETGEELTKHNAEKNYLKVGLDKYVTLNKNKTHGSIYYTHKYKRNPQRELFTDGENAD